MLIGSDPEFEVRNSKGFLHCCNSFKDSSMVNTDIVEEVGKIRHRRGHFGTDGCSNTGELRPFQGTPAEHTKNIGVLLNRLAKSIGEDRQVYAGSGKFVPLGGHIHFSGVTNTPEFREVLDKTIYEYLQTVSAPDNRDMRHRSGYGVKGSYRDNSWGFEYRAPLSWITHPIIARGVLETAYQVAKLQQEMFIVNGSDSALQLVKAVQTPKDILNFCQRDTSVVIEKYHDFIEEMQRNKIFIEDIEVLQAWKIRNKRFSELLVPENEAQQRRTNYRYNITRPDIACGGSRYGDRIYDAVMWVTSGCARMLANRASCMDYAHYSASEHITLEYDCTMPYAIKLYNFPRHLELPDNKFRIHEDSVGLLINLHSGYANPSEIRPAMSRPVSSPADSLLHEFPYEEIQDRVESRPFIKINPALFGFEHAAQTDRFLRQTMMLILLFIIQQLCTTSFTDIAPPATSQVMNDELISKVSSFLSYKPMTESRRKKVCVG